MYIVLEGLVYKIYNENGIGYSSILKEGEKNLEGVVIDIWSKSWYCFFFNNY